MDELTSVFIQESREQLTEMERGLLLLEQNPETSDDINAIFRAAHTIKGAAGVIECKFIVAFMHLVENVLDRLRNHEIPITSDLAGLLLRCCDHTNTLIAVLESGADGPDAAQETAGNALLLELSAYSAEADAPSGQIPVEHESTLHSSGGGIVSTDSWHISVRFGPDVLRGGMDPLSFLRYLASLGEVLNIETVADAMPAGDEMDPESCYLGFEIQLQSRASKADIERVFDFVRDDCDLRILPPNSKVSEYLQLIAELPEDNMRLGEMLVRCGALTQTELDSGLCQQNETQPDITNEDAPPPPQLGEILIEHKVVQRELVDAAINKQTQVSEKKAVEARLIRVQADKLDQLIDLVGELVIAGASANLLAQKSGLGDLVESTSVLTRLVENIRDSALQLRMVQIGETFNRFNRVVRDVAKEVGKEIELVISGAETELDKTVVEKIGDPLMHLVRNAMDHGIETPAIREAHGKPRQGRLQLNSYHDSGSIVIEVNDDGGGLPRDKILKKAIERGLVQPTQVLSDQEIVNLIFEPGFSTADKVTNLSGRGVGMDVVRRNIQSLRGSVDVNSVEGEGSTFTIRLPLTLAIIDGFLVGVGKSAYVIPLDMVVECIELKDNTADRDFLNLRGEVLPFVRLRQMFEVEGEAPARENIVVVQYAGQKAGIVVDLLLGEFQTVIKPLSSIFRHLRGIGGSTILGSGEVALILDVQTLVQRNARAEEKEMNRTAALRATPQN